MLLGLNFEQEHRDVDLMPNFVGSAPVEQVADQTVAVRSHSNKVHILFLRQLDDLIRRLTER